VIEDHDIPPMPKEKWMILMVPRRVSKERYDTCLECEHLRKTLQQCKLCGCFIKGKVQFQDAQCPDGRWGTWHPRKTTK
jgi:hypothetical protein